MTSPRPYVRRSTQEWYALFEELDASGLDRSAFCREKGLVRETLRQAERRLREHEPRSPFVELTGDLVNGDVGRGWDIELELGDGLVLRLARR